MLNKKIKQTITENRSKGLEELQRVGGRAEVIRNELLKDIAELRQAIYLIHDFLEVEIHQEKKQLKRKSGGKRLIA